MCVFVCVCVYMCVCAYMYMCVCVYNSIAINHSVNLISRHIDSLYEYNINRVNIIFLLSTSFLVYNLNLYIVLLTINT